MLCLSCRGTVGSIQSLPSLVGMKVERKKFLNGWTRFRNRMIKAQLHFWNSLVTNTTLKKRKFNGNWRSHRPQVHSRVYHYPRDLKPSDFGCAVACLWKPTNCYRRFGTPGFLKEAWNDQPTYHCHRHLGANQLLLHVSALVDPNDMLPCCFKQQNMKDCWIEIRVETTHLSDDTWAKGAGVLLVEAKPGPHCDWVE